MHHGPIDWNKKYQRIRDKKVGAQHLDSRAEGRRMHLFEGVVRKLRKRQSDLINNSLPNVHVCVCRTASYFVFFFVLLCLGGVPNASTAKTSKKVASSNGPINNRLPNVSKCPPFLVFASRDTFSEATLPRKKVRPE